MIHVLSVAWQVAPELVVVFTTLCVMLIALVACGIAIATMPKISNRKINDYVYSKRATDNAPTLIDTKAEWSYQPQTVNLRGN